MKRKPRRITITAQRGMYLLHVAHAKIGRKSATLKWEDLDTIIEAVAELEVAVPHRREWTIRTSTEFPDRPARKWCVTMGRFYYGPHHPDQVYDFHQAREMLYALARMYDSQ